MVLRNRTFKQKRAQETYAAILEAAARVFPRLGFDGTQTPDIATEAGVSTGAVYRYFRDKRQIFLEMVELQLAHRQREVQERLSAVAAAEVASDPAAAVTHVLETLFDQAKKDAALTRVFLALSLTDPDVAAIRATADATDRAVLASFIEAAIPRPIVPDPAATAFVVQVTAVSLAVELALRRRKPRASSD
ncbi:MAG: TetR/AcrR family transcriptional regulator, partial [Polyangiaceae bacterium]